MFCYIDIIISVARFLDTSLKTHRFLGITIILLLASALFGSNALCEKLNGSSFSPAPQNKLSSLKHAYGKINALRREDFKVIAVEIDHLPNSVMNLGISTKAIQSIIVNYLANPAGGEKAQRRGILTVRLMTPKLDKLVIESDFTDSSNDLYWTMVWNGELDSSIHPKFEQKRMLFKGILSALDSCPEPVGRRGNSKPSVQTGDCLSR